MSGTGKTNIINTMTNQPFDSNKISTLASTFIEKVIEKKNIAQNYGTQPIKKNINL